ncbi:MAG: UDP-glucose 4-epimerase GalE [Thermodesulfobacteriota bacterium]
MKKILIVGGAGYIGSHMVKHLVDHGYAPLVLDDLSKGHADAVPEGRLVQGDLGDRRLLAELFGSHHFEAVMHFAAFIEVGESMAQPARYFHNNICKTLVLLDAMREHGVGNFIFSSTAAVYGEPRQIPIDELHPLAPINPYGFSKFAVEQALRDYDRAYGLRFTALRYFNAAGADPEGALGERHSPESHLIPLVLEAAAGTREAITIFGQDYDTPDGTCIRDYIHVADLCQAHRLAMERLWAGGDSTAYNLGNGQGFSVREVIDTAGRVTGRRIPVRLGARREGDPARLVAESRKAREELAWRPEYADLETIVAHAWAFKSRRQEG